MVAVSPTLTTPMVRAVIIIVRRVKMIDHQLLITHFYKMLLTPGRDLFLISLPAPLTRHNSYLLT